MPKINLNLQKKSPEFLNINNYPFINREISWLYFNERVLSKADSQNVPSLERLKFLSIFSSNLDEFYMIRVAGVKEVIDAGYISKSLVNEPAPQELLQLINRLAQQLIDKQQNIFLKLVKTFKSKKIVFILTPDEIAPDIIDLAEEIWLQEIMPAISPVIIGPAKPFPFVYNKLVSIFAELHKGGNKYYAIIVLENLKRMYKINYNNTLYIIFAENIILKFINRIFSSYTIQHTNIIRITRNADFDIAEDAEDLLETIEFELSKRKKGDVVRVETNSVLDLNAMSFLKSKLNFSSTDVLNIKYTIDLSCLSELNINRKQLLYKPFKQYFPSDIHLNSSIFKRIKNKDIILYRPYNSFNIISKLVEIASNDINVIAIKMTLYRTNKDSSIIKSLINAAKKGKQVSIIIELKARFDEEKNIEWSKVLEDAGCIVTYGFLELKLHTKNLLIVRRENKKIVRYCHISTGNYNEITANIYTDVDYLTADEQIGSDITNLFNSLMGYSEFGNYKRITVSPGMIRNRLIELIDEEIINAQKGLTAKIAVKINALTDKKIILKLYEASKAGVKIIMVIRGICCLVPGIKDISENIIVKSMVGRFLEHPRILYFYAGGEEKTFISTADWMERNMDKRIELLLEIQNADAKEKLMTILDCNMRDNYNSWILQQERYVKYDRTASHNDKQNEFHNKIAEFYLAGINKYISIDSNISNVRKEAEEKEKTVKYFDCQNRLGEIFKN